MQSREGMLDTTDNSIADFQTDIDKAISAIETIILGKSIQVKLAVCCLIARGHCLIEDLPGVGKTTLSQTIAQAALEHPVQISDTRVFLFPRTDDGPALLASSRTWVLATWCLGNLLWLLGLMAYLRR